MNAIAIVIHSIAATIWIGGMFFAYVVLRPTAAALEPHRRLPLWSGVFKRFFPWVWMTVIALWLSGYWLVFNAFGGFATSPAYVHIMQLIGIVMSALFIYLYYRPYVILKREVENENWPDAGAALNRIRQIVLLNLILGLLLLAVVNGGRYGMLS